MKCKAALVSLLSLALPTWALALGDDSALDALSVESSRFDDLPAVVLDPVIGGSGLQKRRDKLDLQNKLRLDWGKDGASATLDADFDGDDEHVINMEDFRDVLERVDCTAPQLALDFINKASLDDAIKRWSWVNEKEVRHFILIVNHPACPSHVRAPYKVSNVRYDNKKHIAYLKAEKSNYKSVIHDGHLVLEAAGSDSDTRSARTLPGRDISSSWSTPSRRFRRGPSKRASISKDISIAKDFSGNIWSKASSSSGTKGNSSASASLDCTDCGTTGKIKLKLDVSIKLLSIKKAYLEFRADNVAARLNLALSGSLDSKYEDSKQLFAFSAVGFEIPEIAKLSLGPAFGVGWTAEMKGSGNVTWGAEAALTPNSVARLCLKGCDTGSEGFKVTFTKKPPTAQGTLSTSLSVHSYITLSAGAKLFSKKYEAGLAVIAPRFVGKFDAKVDSNGGVCSNPAFKLGVEASLTVGVDAYAYIGKSYQKPDKRYDVFKGEEELFKDCFGMKRRGVHG